MRKVKTVNPYVNSGMDRQLNDLATLLSKIFGLSEVRVREWGPVCVLNWGRKIRLRGSKSPLLLVPEEVASSSLQIHKKMGGSS